MAARISPLHQRRLLRLPVTPAFLPLSLDSLTEWRGDIPAVGWLGLTPLPDAWSPRRFEVYHNAVHGARECEKNRCALRSYLPLRPLLAMKVMQWGFFSALSSSKRRLAAAVSLEQPCTSLKERTPVSYRTNGIRNAVRISVQRYGRIEVRLRFHPVWPDVVYVLVHCLFLSYRFLFLPAQKLTQPLGDA